MDHAPATATVSGGFVVDINLGRYRAGRPVAGAHFATSLGYVINK